MGKGKVSFQEFTAYTHVVVILKVLLRECEDNPEKVSVEYQNSKLLLRRQKTFLTWPWQENKIYYIYLDVKDSYID